MLTQPDFDSITPGLGPAEPADFFQPPSLTSNIVAAS